MRLLLTIFPSASFFLRSCLLLSALLAAGSAWAQAGNPSATVRVSGRVSEASTKRPIPGATVQVQRTRQGLAADGEGNFLVTALPTDTLLFRAIGFKPHRLVLGGTSLSQLVVQIVMVRDSVQLGEVRVTADRPDRASINRALRNIKRPVPVAVKIPKRAPKPKPLFAVDSTAPKPEAPDIATSNVDWIYDQFSRAGKQRRKLEQLKAQDAEEKARQQREQYHKTLQNNQGYQ